MLSPKLKHTIKQLLNVVVVPAMFIFSLIRLLYNFRNIREAELIVVMEEGGFGHTCILPDAMRRLFPGKKLLCICLSYYKRHNWKISLIWPDIVQIFLPLQAGISLIGHRFISASSVLYRDVLVRFISKITRLINNTNAEIIPYDEFLTSYLAPLAPETFKNSSSEAGNAALYQWITGYYSMIEAVDVQRASLPRHISANIVKKLDSVSKLKDKKYCGLYLRDKGKNKPDDYNNAVRDGSTLEDYLPAVKFLNKNGYQVLLTGDVSCPESVYKEFQGMLADYKNLKCNEKYFNLFACTGVDIFIGEQGGAITLPVVNKTPILSLNAYPYAFTVTGCSLWVHYKTLRDSSGNLIHYRDIFKDSPYLYDYHIQKNYTLHENSSDEILNAVKYFIEDVKNISTLRKEDRTVENSLPDYVFVKHENARISPAFLELFDK